MKYGFPIVAFLASSACFGQVAEFSVAGGLNKLSSKTLGAGYSLDDGWRLAFRITLNNWKFFGHEFGYGYARTHLKLNGADQGGMAIHHGLYHFLVYATPEGKRIRPFASGGGHFANFVPPGASATQGGGQNKFGVNYGGGVKFRVTEKYGIRFDLRQYLTGKPDFRVLPVSGSLKQTEATIGFAFML